jgi:hypothetical protein
VEKKPLRSHSTTGVWPSLSRFTESDEPVWRGYLYPVILLNGDGHLFLGLQSLMSQCGEDTSTQPFYQLVYRHLSLGLQSLMSQCGEDTSMWLPSPSPFSPTSSSAANMSWCSGKLV